MGDITETNPLLMPSPLTNMAPQFDLIKTEHYVPALDYALDLTRASIESIKNNTDEPTFKNTMVALEEAVETLNDIHAIYDGQFVLNMSDEMRAINSEISEKISEVSSEISFDEGLFKRIKNLHDRKDSLGLNTEQLKLLTDSYDKFIRDGVGLKNQTDKDRLKEISAKLSILGTQFTQNVVDSAKKFEWHIQNKDELKKLKLPQSTLDQAANLATERNKTGHLFTLDMPSYLSIMTQSANREKRKEIYLAFTNRAWGTDNFDNTENMKEILELRHEAAKILGYKNHAERVISSKMPKTPQKAEALLKSLEKTYKTAAQKDINDIKEIAAKDGITDLQAWDVGYYTEKLKQERFDISDEEIKKYFPLDQVLSGLFETFKKEYGVRFEKNTTNPTWHKDVRVFDMYDGDEYKTTYYLDPYTRENKRPGAWAGVYRNQGLYKGKIERPVVAASLNCSPATNEKPSLLTHNEVVTLFHEWGHDIHAGCSDTELQSTSSFNIDWTIIELPSQYNENFAYEPEVLKRISRHIDTGESLPEHLITKLKEAKNFMAGLQGLRQGSFASMDLKMHQTDPKEIIDFADFEKEALNDFALLPRDRDAGTMLASFSHIFAGGYAAGYYSYKWAEVLSAWAYELHEKNPEQTAKNFMEHILKAGASDDINTLLRKFGNGQDPDPKSLLRSQGLMEDTRAENDNEIVIKEPKLKLSGTAPE